ncbi:unnamed protein product [Notodromas monacha]|uniref:Flavin-containing monooxygenase n=1 Tax=Notodromas monacha TaxID=399045 RepID=A0A7R9BI92_9CRUS|nr:unnamed protein product [Notodromas monacha]CAG0915132.1 unnamed protein product [Notodromas monacha]
MKSLGNMLPIPTCLILIQGQTCLKKLWGFLDFHLLRKKLPLSSTKMFLRIWWIMQSNPTCYVTSRHYFCPIYPAIPGYDTFKGLKMHCHDFRDPKSLKDIASLALVGAGPSGQDLAVELSKHVEKIYLVVKTGSKTKMGALPQNVVRMFDPKEFTQEGILLTSGDTVKVDAVMLCTGYHYAFPFLSPECGITVERQRISPLYKHCVHVRYPTMFFIGVVSTVLPFVLFHFQMEFCTRLLSTKGETKLPSIEEMNQDSEQELSRRLAMGWPEHYYHRMAELQWDYMDDLASLAGVESFSPVLKKLYQHVGGWRMIDLTSYKNRKYRLLNKEEFVDITGDGRVPNPGLIPPNDFRS